MDATIFSSLRILFPRTGVRASRKLPAREIVTAIPESMRIFCGGYTLSDDITLRVIRVK